MPIHGVPVPRVSTETLALMAEGYSNADIAAMLVPTVKQRTIPALPAEAEAESAPAALPDA
jgi:hypothetical protein